MKLKKNRLLLILILALLMALAAGCSGLSEEALDEFAAQTEGAAEDEEIYEEADEEPAPETDPELELEMEPVPFGPFTTNDVEGNLVDDSIFYGHDLTMVNVWATYCGPCINEMPELGELNAEYGDNFQVVGFVCDVLASDGSISERQVEFARQIIEQTGASYTHLLPSEDFNWLLGSVTAVPTTLFVNGRGEIVGEMLLGSRDKAGWAAVIDSLMPAAEGSASAQQALAADNTAAANADDGDWQQLVLPIAAPDFPDCCE